MDSKGSLFLSFFLGLFIGVPLLVVASVLGSFLFDIDSIIPWMSLALLMSLSAILMLCFGRFSKRKKANIFVAWQAALWCSTVFWEFARMAAHE